MIIYFLISFAGLLLSLFLISFLKKIPIKNNLLKSSGVPLTGGIAICISFVFLCLLGCSGHGVLSREIIGLVVASCVILVFGVADDINEASVITKFSVQIISTAVLILFGIRTQIVYIGNIPNIIITIIWMLAITNSFNLLDIMDGLAGGTAIIVSTAFFAISVLNGDIRIIILSLALIISTMGFLLYNLPPAKIYMGNSGSHFLGFLLAAFALAISYAPMERKVALLSPILILGLPILDTAFLVLMRLYKKKIPFNKSNDHIALRFLKLGYSKEKALLSMLFIGLFFSLCGVLVSKAPNSLGIVVVLAVILVSLALTRNISRVSIDG